jgi:ribonuclease VapC
MFIDASALVAILTREMGWEPYADAIDENPGSLTGPMAVFETALAVARKQGVQAAAARTRLESFLADAGVEITFVAPAEAMTAVAAYDRFGKGRHPAALNMGDCFSYAAAVTRGLPLLYKGGDFALTDIASALDA